MIHSGLFDMQKCLESLSKFGDLLEKLKKILGFEVFREGLEIGLRFADRFKGSRPPFDAVFF